MKNNYSQIIKKATGATFIDDGQLIQNLWSNYGEIIRFTLEGSKYRSVVLKDVKLSINEYHPNGWETDISHNRKLKSYRIESEWYKNWSHLCNNCCKVPKLLDIEYRGDEILLILEDLDDIGFSIRKRSVTINDMKLCIKWLANFHGLFMGTKPQGLWEKGTYWYLETRPDELNKLTDVKLKNAAWDIDKKLDSSPFQTIVHGDAKLENFCFSNDGLSVAAVDFQYVGGGVGVKDLVYFIGSCLQDSECEKYETELTNYYFNELKHTLINKDIDFNLLEKSWRELYSVAWADFHRFLKGWSPGYWSPKSYSERITNRVIDNLWS